MKHVSLDKANKLVRDFVRSLLQESDGSILELDGKPVLKVVPVAEEPVDKATLKEAIRKRREESRILNKEWEAADREVWDRIPDGGE